MKTILLDYKSLLNLSEALLLAVKEYNEEEIIDLLHQRNVIFERIEKNSGFIVNKDSEVEGMIKDILTIDKQIMSEAKTHQTNIIEQLKILLTIKKAHKGYHFTYDSNLRNLDKSI